MDLAGKGSMSQWVAYLKTKQELQARRAPGTSGSARKKEKTVSCRQEAIEPRMVHGLRGETGLRKSIMELKLQVEGMRRAVTTAHTRQNSEQDQFFECLPKPRNCVTIADVQKKPESCGSTEKNCSTTSSSIEERSEDWWKAHRSPLPPPHPPTTQFYLLVSQQHGQFLYKDTPLHLGLTSQRPAGFHLYTSLPKASCKAGRSAFIMRVEAKGKVIAAGEEEGMTSAVTPVKVVK